MTTDAAGNAIAEEGDVVLPVAEPPKDADVRSPTWEENKVRRGWGERQVQSSGLFPPKPT